MTAVVARLSAILWLAGPPAASPAATDPAAPSAATEVRHAVVLDVALAEDTPLREELALRLVDRPIVAAGPAFVAPAEPFVWAGVTTVDDNRAEIRLVGSDGRGFRRTIEAPPQQRARVVAGVIANMIDAIDHNRLAPQETGVRMPVAEPEPEPPPKPEAPPPSEPVSSPGPIPAAAADPLGPPPSWIGIHLSGRASFGLGPPADVAGVTRLAGGAGIELVHRTGAWVVAELDGGGWRNDGPKLTRVRVGAVAGYAWRPNRFELRAGAGPRVEIVRVDAELVAPSGTPRRDVPLVGGVVSLRPAYAVVVRPRAWELLVGLEVEGSVTTEARSPTGAIRIYAANDATQAVARAGGFELGLGVFATARFGVGPGRRPVGRAGYRPGTTPGVASAPPG